MSPRARRAIPWVVAKRVIIALSEMVGVAALVGIMMVVLGGDGDSSALVARIKGWLGIDGTSFIIIVCTALLILFILKSVVVILLNRSQSVYMRRIFEELSSKMFDKYLHSGLLYIRSHNSSEIINNTTAICARFSEGIVGVMLSLAGGGVMLLMIVVALIIYDPMILLLAVAVFIPFTAAYALFFRRRMVRDGREENRAAVGQNKLMYESLRGYSDVEIYGAENSVTQKFGEGLHKLGRLRLRNMTIRASSSAVVEFSLVAGVVVMIVVGLAMGRDIAALRVSLGVFAVAAYKIAPSVSKLVNGFTELHRSRYAIERLQTSSEIEVRQTESAEPVAFAQNIEMRNISFTYPNGKQVLNNYSLTITRGERLGISGTSGIGKTTLLNIVCALFEPSKGELLVDGVRIDAHNRRGWQTNLAYVSQEVFLPDVSIAENIAFGVQASNIDRERVLWALRAASLGNFVDSLTEGIDTITGEAGARLSGGQKQRIGIARALYKGASVLLFDEATSSLDKETENAVIDTIQTLSQDLTIVIISHNERTLRLC